MTAAFTIRAAGRADAPVIQQLVRELAEYEKLLERVTSTPEDIAEHLFGARPAAEALVAECQGEVVGFALFFTTFSTFAGRPGIYLEDLFVREAYRRQGMGRALFHRLARLAVERGCARFEWSVLDWNAPALDFYRGLGAVPLADWTMQRLSGEALQRLARNDCAD